MSSGKHHTASTTTSAPAPKRRRSAIRWTAPVAAAALAVGGGLAANTAAADPTLPKKSPKQLLTAVAGAQPDSLSGTVTEKANLGLPSLPGLQGQGSQHQKSASNFSALLSGKHTLKVWTAGKNKSRVALLGDDGESDAIRNGNHGWLWSSSDKSATHVTFPKHAGAHQQNPSGARGNPMPTTPQQAAKQALDQIGPTTKTSVARNVTVAGRPAYELVLKPQDSDTLVSQVRIAVDGKTSTPLKVDVDAAGQNKTALSVGFRSVDFSVPDAETFRFSPPPGADVNNHKVTDNDADQAQADGKTLAKASKTVGSGWTQVQVSNLNKAARTKHSPKANRDTSDDKQLRQVVKSLPKVSGSWGSGHLLSGSLFSAVLTDNGRLAVGAVKPAVLYQALS